MYQIDKLCSLPYESSNFMAVVLKCMIVFPGDRVLEINGMNLEHYNRKQAVQLLRASANTVKIILERYKGAGLQLDEKAMSIEQDILKASVGNTCMAWPGDSFLEKNLH